MNLGWVEQGGTMTQRIAYPENPVMAIAWAGFIRYCVGSAEIVAQYEAETGNKPFWRQRRSGLEAMIDAATGREVANVEAFIDWVNTTLWGEDPFKLERPMPLSAPSSDQDPGCEIRDSSRRPHSRVSTRAGRR